MANGSDPLTRGQETLQPRSRCIEALSAPEISDLVGRGWTNVVLPLGAMEQHGPALPQFVDCAHGLETVRRAVKRLPNTLIAPVIPFGYSSEHAAFPGTISLTETTLRHLLTDVVESLARGGFTFVYLWYGHGGDFAVVDPMLDSLNTRWPRCRVGGLRDMAGYVAATWDKVPLKYGVPNSVSGSHAGEFEVSMMLAIDREAVRLDHAEKGSPLPFEEVSEQMMAHGIESVSKNGVLGDQRPGNAERGGIYLDTLADYLVQDFQKEYRRCHEKT